MDSNGTRFLLLNSAADFGERSASCGWDHALGAFMLDRRDPPRLPQLPATEARALLAACTPLVIDGHGQLGRLSADRRSFEFALHWPAAPADWRPVRAEAVSDDDGSVEGSKSASGLTLDPVDAPAGSVFTDLHLGADGLAALCWSGAGGNGLTLVDLARRWQVQCRLDFAPSRVWVDAERRVWVAGAGQLGLCRGGPLPQPYTPRPDRFEPSQLNPDPLRQRWRQALPTTVDAAGESIALAGLIGLCADADRLYLLVDLAPRADGTPRQAIVRRRLEPHDDVPLEVFRLTDELPYATDLAVASAELRHRGELLLLAPLDAQAKRESRLDCAVVWLDRHATDGPLARLQAERWPMRSLAAPRFVRSPDGQPRYLADDRPRRLYPLAQARFAASAKAVLPPLDAGDPDVLWHRLVIEASIPEGCRLGVAVRVCNDWEERGSAGWDAQQPPVWLRQGSELPFDPGRLSPVAGRQGHFAGRQGHFEILLQRPRGRVRELRGRYLELKLELSGDGRTSPAVHAIRAWFPRFSWQQAYLPEHFHQQETPPQTTPPPPPPDAGPEVLEALAANAADLRERLLACLEGMLTPIEDRIAASEQLLYPEAMPAERLNGFAAMLGGELPAHWPERRRREWLAHLGLLQQRRGSYAGLCLALDIATDGAVGRGQVVPVEDFRLRRTLATVLGIDFDDAHHPLTLGTGQSGNSRVGESLILGEENGREFLALFAPELAARQDEAAVVSEFFDRHARRLTVVLHGEARQLRRVVEATLADQVPAILQWVVRETDHPFVLGLSPLLQIDTYLERQPPFGRVVLDHSRLGRGDLLTNPAALSPEHALPRQGA